MRMHAISGSPISFLTTYKSLFPYFLCSQTRTACAMKWLPKVRSGSPENIREKSGTYCPHVGAARKVNEVTHSFLAPQMWVHSLSATRFPASAGRHKDKRLREPASMQETENVGRLTVATRSVLAVSQATALTFLNFF